MNSYLFVLGTAHELALAELTHILSFSHKHHTLSSPTHAVVRIDVSDELPVQDLNEILGGTIKIAKIVGEVKTLSSEYLLPVLNPSDHFVFGFSLYGKFAGSLSDLCSELKEAIQKEGKKCRFVLPHEGTVLSSVVLKKQNIVEYVLLFDVKTKNWQIAQTMTFQNVDAWSGRDVGRPHIDAKSGMLPLKVARMMVNLGETGGSKKVLLDPFCGMGSILSEAVWRGWDVIGSDISADVIAKTQQNLDWLKKSYGLDKSLVQLLTTDAAHVSDHIPQASVDAIVTEPFLGAPFEQVRGVLFQKGKKVTPESLKNTIKGLEKLYIGALREFSHVLRPGGRIIIVIPEVEYMGVKYLVKKPVDSCENLGYTLSQGPYMYSRPQAIVKRTIYIFTKK